MHFDNLDIIWQICGRLATMAQADDGMTDVSGGAVGQSYNPFFKATDTKGIK
jgi:hypothetical protein